MRPMKKWTNVALEEAERAIHHFEFVPSGTEGLAKAEVTTGSVNTEELSRAPSARAYLVSPNATKAPSPISATPDAIR